MSIISLFPGSDPNAPAGASPAGVSPVAPDTSAGATPQPSSTSTAVPGTLDPDAVNLTKAIRQQETGGDFSAVGKSGEYGAYQFEPDTWDKLAPEYGVTGVSLQNATPEQQNQVAYGQIKAWKDAGFNVGQIASMWNAGEGEPNAYQGTFNDGSPAVGTNSYGAQYDVPTYAKGVATTYQQLKAASGANQPNAGTTGTPTTSGQGLLGASSFLNDALSQYQDNAGQANANGGQGTAVGNFLGKLVGLAPGEGTLVGNALRIPEAVAAGVAKVPFDAAGNLAQAATGAFEAAAAHGAARKGGFNPAPGATALEDFAGQDNPLNQNSPSGQAFQANLRGQDIASKTGKTLGDLGAIIEDPGDLIGNVGGAAQTIADAYTSALPDTGVIGKVAGYLPKAARAAAEGAYLTPFLNGTTPTAKSTVINALAPAVLEPVLKGVAGLLIPKIGQAAADKSLSEIQDAVSSAHNPGDPGVTANPGADPSVVSRVTKLKNDFISGMQKYIDKAPNGFQTGLDFANNKFANVASREANAESALTGSAVAPKDNNLLNYLFDTHGGIDGVDAQGRPITQKAQATQQGIIDEISPLLNKIYSSSNETIDGDAIGQGALKTAQSGKYGIGDPTIQAKNIVQRQIASIPELSDQNASPADLYKVSQDLRNQAYQHTNSFKTTQQPIDSVAAQVKRDIAAKIDSELGKVKDVDSATTQRIRNLQTRAYTARDFLQHMETLKAPSEFTKTVGKAIGGAAGWTAAGWPGAIVGASGGARIVSRLQQAFSDLNLSSDVMAKFAQKATEDQINQLKTLAENIISKNETSAAERAANDLKIKDVLARTLPAPDLTVERPAQVIRRSDTGPAPKEPVINQGAPAEKPRLNAPGQNPVPLSSRFPQGNQLPITGNVPGGYVEPPANTVRRYVRPEPVPQLNAPGQNPIPLSAYYEH